MKTIKGFICLAETDFYSDIPFGPNKSGAEKSYENFQSNGLVPFKSLAEAETAEAELEKVWDIKSVTLAEIEMKVAETEEEIQRFKNEKSLVVVWQGEEFDKPLQILIGRLVEDRDNIYPLPGARLDVNGMAPLDSFDAALHIIREIRRQAQCPAYLATFKLERL